MYIFPFAMIPIEAIYYLLVYGGCFLFSFVFSTVMMSYEKADTFLCGAAGAISQL